MARTKRKFSKKKMKAAIFDSAGIVSKVAKRLGCEWHTAESRIKEDTELKALFESENEKVLDLGEDRLITAVDGGEAWAIKYLLSTKGKIRGYTERQEIDANQVIKIVADSDDMKA